LLCKIRYESRAMAGWCLNSRQDGRQLPGPAMASKRWQVRRRIAKQPRRILPIRSAALCDRHSPGSSLALSCTSRMAVASEAGRYQATCHSRPVCGESMMIAPIYVQKRHRICATEVKSSAHAGTWSRPERRRIKFWSAASARLEQSDLAAAQVASRIGSLTPRRSKRLPGPDPMRWFPRVCQRGSPSKRVQR